MVVAIVLADRPSPPGVTLVEADQRKAAFLREAARVLELPVRVVAERAETAAPLSADVISARALAPLPLLLDLVIRHMAPGGVALLQRAQGMLRNLRWRG